MAVNIGGNGPAVMVQELAAAVGVEAAGRLCMSQIKLERLCFDLQRS